MTDTADEFARLLPLIAADLPMPCREWLFAKPRRWRFDFAWPVQLVAVEVDGGAWLPHGGRHNTDADRDKLNHAAALGWRVLRCSTTMLRDDPGSFIDLLRMALCQTAS